MSDPFALRKNVTMSVVAFAANIALVFVSYRLVILRGGLEALGLWSTLMAWIYVIRLGDVGMATATLRFVARCDATTEGPRIRRYVDTGLWLNGGLFLALALVGYLVFSWQMDVIVPSSEVDRATAIAILPLMLCGFVLTNLSGLTLGALRGIHLAWLSAWITIAGTVLQLVIVVFTVPSYGLGGLALGQVGQHLFMVLIGWLLFRRHLARLSGHGGSLVPRSFDTGALREMFGFSVKAQVANLANGFFEPLAKILIGRFAGLEILGLFEMAYKLVSLPRNAAVSGVQATIPSITRLLATDRPAARALYARSLRLVTLAGLGTTALSLLASPVVSAFMLGQVSGTFILFVGLVATGFFINLTGAPAHTLGVATGHLRANIAVSVASLGLLLAGCVPLAAQAQAWPHVLVVAVALAAGGIAIKWANERLLAG